MDGGGSASKGYPLQVDGVTSEAKSIVVKILVAICLLVMLSVFFFFLIYIYFVASQMLELWVGATVERRHPSYV